MITALGFIPSWAWRWIALGLILVAAAGFGWVKGNEHGTEKLTEYIGKEAVARVAIITKQGKVTEQVIDHFIQVEGKTTTVTKTVHDEVIRYVESNPGYCLDAAWGRLYDRAAANTVSDPAGRTDGAERAPTAAGALEAVTESYAACHRTADRLDGLQAWVRAQQKIAPVLNSSP